MFWHHLYCLHFIDMPWIVYGNPSIRSLSLSLSYNKHVHCPFFCHKIERLIASFHYPFLIAVANRFFCFIELSPHLLSCAKLNHHFYEIRFFGGLSVESLTASQLNWMQWLFFTIVSWITLYKADYIVRRNHWTHTKKIVKLGFQIKLRKGSVFLFCLFVHNNPSNGKDGLVFFFVGGCIDGNGFQSKCDVIWHLLVILYIQSASGRIYLPILWMMIIKSNYVMLLDSRFFGHFGWTKFNTLTHTQTTERSPKAMLTPFGTAYRIAWENIVFNGIRCQKTRFFYKMVLNLILCCISRLKFST